MEITKITEDEVRALWVQRLSDTPNRQTRFGGEGLSAAEVKAVYDALPLCLVGRYNALVDAIAAGELGKAIPLYGDLALSELSDEITGGGLAERLSVDGNRSLLALAIAFDSHGHEGYARLAANGKLLPEQLPSGGEGAFAEAEAARVAAEEARVAAEAERGKRLDGIAADMETLEEGARTAALHTAAMGARIENLEAAAVGTTHVFLEEKAAAYQRDVPKGALPYAAIDLIGGATDPALCTCVTAISSHGASVLPYPYPASRAGVTVASGITVRQLEDGSLILDGTAERNVSHFLYTEKDCLSLPDEGVYIDSFLANGVTLNVKTGMSGNVYKTGGFTPSPSDELYGRYIVYLYIPKGTVLQNVHVLPSITRGLTPRTGVRYHAPETVMIPPAVQALPGYGLCDNVLDLEAGLYRQRRGADGRLLAEEITYPLPAPFDAPLYLPCDEGGYLLLENAEGAAVEATVTFAKRIG